MAMKINLQSCAWALALVASSATAIDVVLVPSPDNPDKYSGQFETTFLNAGQYIPTWQFVSPVPGTLSFELVPSGFVQFLGYQFDRGPVTSFSGAAPTIVTGIAISAGPHELLVGYQAAPQLPPRTPATGGFTGTLTIASAIPEPHIYMLLAAGLLMTVARSVRGRRKRLTD